MRVNSFLFLIALFGLLTAGLAAPASARAPLSLPDSYTTSIEASEDEVHGTWQRGLEKVTFFLDHDTPTTRQEVGDLGVVYLPDDTQSDKGYFHYEPPVGKIPVEPNNEAFYEPFHENDKRVTVSNLPETGVNAQFRLPTIHDSLPMDLQPSREYRIHGVEATLYVSCPTINALALDYEESQNEIEDGIEINLRYQTINPDGTYGNYHDFAPGVRDHQDFFTGGHRQGKLATGTAQLLGSSLTGLNPYPVFQINYNFDNLGNFNLDEGHLKFVADPEKFLPVLDVQLDSASPLGYCQLHFGSEDFPSNFRLITDTASFNTWIDDKDDEFTAGLPSGTATSQDQRRMKAVVAQASAWPQHNAFKYRSADEYNFVDNSWTGDAFSGESSFFTTTTETMDTERLFMRWRNLDTGTVEYDTRTGDDDTVNRIIKPIQGTRTVDVLPDGLNLIKQDFLYGAALPDASYRFEVYSLAHEYAASTEVLVGKKGFAFELFESPTETDLRHEIERAEPTVYRLLLRNLGAKDDTITLQATGASTGWAAKLSDTRVFLPATGAEASKFGREVYLTMTPSPNLQIGSETTVTLTATSSFIQEVPSQSIKLTTAIVAEQAAGIDVFGDNDLIQVAPGQKVIIQDLFAHNTGTSANTYLVDAKLPGGIGLGWTSRVTPPGKLIEADSIEDFAIEVNVAADAKPGQRITLPVTARLVGNQGTTPVADTLEFPIEVLVTEGLVFHVDESAHALRAATEECGPVPLIFSCNRNDSDARDASLYKIQITNNGVSDEIIDFRADWEGGTVAGIPVESYGNGNSCDGSSGPDLWRADFGASGDPIIDGVATTQRHKDHKAAVNALGTVTVPVGQTVVRWVEMGFLYSDGSYSGCSVDDPSRSALLRVFATPRSDPTDKEEFYLGSYIMGSFSASTVDQATRIHNLDMEPYWHLDTSTQTPPSKESELQNQVFQEVRYRVTVRNEANERDTLSLSTVASNNAAADFKLEYRGDLSPRANYAGCQNSQAATQARTWTCRNMDPFQEVVFDLVVNPTSSASVGSSLSHAVSVVSRDDGLKTDSLTFTTKLVGERSFQSGVTLGARSAEPGQEVTLPFFINNEGTRDDTYSVVLTNGNSDYKPRFSVDDQVFVPASSRLDALLRVKVPIDSEVDDTEVFTALVTSGDEDLGPQTLTFRVKTIADSGIVVRASDGANSVLIQQRGVPQTIDVEAIVANGISGDPMTFRVDRARLPTGWTVDTPVTTSALAPHQAGFVASASFTITAPAGALGTSSVPLIVDVCKDVQSACSTAAAFIASGDIVMNLQDDVGVALILEDPDVVTATLPGGQVVFPIRVENRGLSSDLIELSNTEMATGWSINYDPPIVNLAPLETRVIDVIVTSPVSAAPGAKSAFLLFATSSVDSSEFDQLELSAEIGVFDLQVREGTPLAKLAPGEVKVFTTTVYNNGTLADAVFATPSLVGQAAQDAYGKIVQISAHPSGFDLQPGTSRDVTVTVKVGPSIAPKVTVPTQVTFVSVPNDPAEAVATFDVGILDYRARDIDQDGIVEYAIDRDEKSSNGFEEFKDAVTNAGKTTQPANLVRFLNAEGLARHSVKTTVNGTVVTVTNLVIDGDLSANGKFGDGRVDMFLDDNGDGLPDIYWDADDRHSHRITIFKDVDADGVPDYFVDTSGNGALDSVYNLAQGTFTGLIARDVDNDGTMDFVVDKNGNGQIDADETILYAKNNQLIQVTKVDVDGDGKLDDVFDTDGDGVPDYFIPAGKTKGVPLKVERDVNGDGFLDWTYDANRDGKEDHFYDPATKSGGNEIDTAAEFLRSIQQYWYIGGLFILVAALFVVLIAVTRR